MQKRHSFLNEIPQVIDGCVTNGCVTIGSKLKGNDEACHETITQRLL